jgi:hypothetical protein
MFYYFYSQCYAYSCLPIYINKQSRICVNKYKGGSTVYVSIQRNICLDN